MKSYFPYGFIVIICLVSACKDSGETGNPKDTVLHAQQNLSIDSGNNIVKSEAPDASARVTQGYALPRLDEKLSQSPINILSDSTMTDTNQLVSIKFGTDITEIENLGHTVQLDFKAGSDFTVGEKTFTSRQFHFHTPSEHLIDGLTYPMEMHIVNVLKDSNTSNSPRYLVVAFLFKMGKENQFLKEFLNAIPEEEHNNTLPAGKVNFGDLFSAIAKKVMSGGYYSYKGSLTTPPYSESVTWIVNKYILEASPEQIFMIEKFEGD
ncbi:MAG TPA: carbonic anhydrase family protein, partial [Puia sp.]|nr:carbonic anhydrase family protein [Puia sp.]